MKVVIFSAHNESVFTTNLIYKLLDCSIIVDAVIVRRAITRERLREELRSGIGGAIKKFLQFLRRACGLSTPSVDGFSDYAIDHAFAKKSVSELAAEQGIRCLKVDNFNSDCVIRFLEDFDGVTGVFCGGGIVRRRLLDRITILNCHMGILPHYRGHFPWVWAILKRDYGQVGLTLHAMNDGVDTGPILRTKLCDITHCKSVSDVRTTLEYCMTDFFIEGLLVVATSGLREGLFSRQMIGDGVQYFLPHPKLVERSNKLLEERD